MMKSTIEILDRAKGSDSDYSIYKKLGLSAPSVVSQWRKRGHVSAYYAVKLAEMAGIDPTEAIQIAAIESEHEPEKREYLFQVAEKMERVNEKRTAITDSPSGNSLVGRVGIEPTTNGLRVRCSTS